MLQEQDFIKGAELLGIETAAVKAVAEVESSGNGFWSNGDLVILFEPHVFWRQLKKKGIDPNNYLPLYKNVLYEKWKTLPYPKPSDRWAYVNKAAEIDKEAAYSSMSVGKFQIMGFHAKTLGYNSAVEFVEEMKEGEHKHLEAFVKFISINKLTKYLKNLDFEGFALRYNGASYKANKYDEKLSKAYLKYKK